MTAGVEELVHQIASLDEANLQSALCAVGITQSAPRSPCTVGSLSETFERAAQDLSSCRRDSEEIASLDYPG